MQLWAAFAWRAGSAGRAIAPPLSLCLALLAGPGTLAEHLAGGMKLSLSKEEQEARQRVQLPFEHQGQV